MRGRFCCIAADVKLGEGVAIYNFVNLYGCEIGDGTRIGTFVEIQKGARVGRRCKIQSHTFICEGVTIEDEVFIGHGVNFINDKYPRATRADGRRRDRRARRCRRRRRRHKGRARGYNRRRQPGANFKKG
jgi:carbonic anhydrase/acetyltransferase-like protein (isoleucine patch superfamily)